MTTSLCYYAKSFLVKSPSLSCNCIFQSRCQGHPQARRGTDVRVQGYFHVQHKTSREPAKKRMPWAIVVFTGKCPGKMEITEGPLDIDVLEFIRFHPLERKLCLDSKNGQVYTAKTANELLLIKHHYNDIDLILYFQICYPRVLILVVMRNCWFNVDHPGKNCRFIQPWPSPRPLLPK